MKIFFSCSGVGILNRGIESFFREAFDGLRRVEGLEITLYKGAGKEKADERLLRNVPRTGRLATWAGKAIGRNAYVAEQLSTFPSMVRAIRGHRPEIIFYSDSNLGFQLFRWRKLIGVPFRLLFSNGGPVHPPFTRTDYVHQVAPFYYDEAIAAGERSERHRVVPYGINVPNGVAERDQRCKNEARTRCGLPLNRQIVLSVGSISAVHKRMDYVVEELATLPRPRPFLLLLGSVAPDTSAIASLARDRLGEGDFAIRSVPYDQVTDYYRAADLFVLASLKEGFGRVFLEALVHGLPVVAHDHPVMRFVLGDEATFGDLSKAGALAGLNRDALLKTESLRDAERRREMVRERFSWPVLAPHYRDMFFDCFEKVKPSLPL